VSAGRSGKKSLASATLAILTMETKYNNTEQHIANYIIKTQPRQLNHDSGQPTPHKNPNGPQNRAPEPKTRKQNVRQKKDKMNKRRQVQDRGSYRFLPEKTFSFPIE
jgi:hypothetical protein